MQTYNRTQIIELINNALDEADQDLWKEIKGRPEEAARLLAAATALEYVKDNMYRLMEDL